LTRARAWDALICCKENDQRQRRLDINSEAHPIVPPIWIPTRSGFVGATGKEQTLVQAHGRH
jgi:hypothetical protein